jgi:HJR/Mrr/RecB family endonuclease
MEKTLVCALCRRLLPLPPKESCAWATCPRFTTTGQKISQTETEKNEMTGREFELFVRGRLADLGYPHIETTSESGDMGADLIVRQKGRVIVIQCKRYSGTVGLQAVQEVLGAKHFYRADEAWVITDSVFTESARKLAESAQVWLMELQTSPTQAREGNTFAESPVDPGSHGFGQ